MRPLLCALALAAASVCAAVAQAQTPVQTEVASLLEQGQAQQALERAEAALQRNPRDVQLRFLRANAQLALGQSEAADASYTELTETWPELAEPWNNLATIRAAQGRLDEARRLLEQALRNDPDYAQAHVNLAQVLVQQAVAHLQTAARLQPQQASALEPRLQALQRAAALPHK